MAIKTKCQTDGAIYNTDISSNEVNISVKLPFNLDLSEEESELLEANLHNVMELVLSPYFLNKDVNSDQNIKKFSEHKKVHK